MKKTLVIGVGSILRGDDGVGAEVVNRLGKEKLSQNIKLEYADVSGLDLLKYFPGFERVIIIDAADMKENAGVVKIFKSSQINNKNFNDAVSTHGVSLLDTLALAKKLDILSEIIIVGVQPRDISFKLGLTREIKKRIPFVVGEIKKVLKIKTPAF